MIGDYYVVHEKVSNFIYIATEEVHCFGINNIYLNQLLSGFQELECSIEMSTLINYNTLILKPINIQKMKYFEDINRKYKSGDDFRPILKKTLPSSYLLDQGSREQLWFRRDQSYKEVPSESMASEDSRNNHF